MSFVDGFAASAPGGVAQATKFICGPFLDIAPVNSRYREDWAQGCLSFNDSVMAYLVKHPEIHNVALSSTLAPYLPRAEGGWRLLVRRSSGSELIAASPRVAMDALEATASNLQRMGRKVLFIAPPPRFDYDPARCVSRMRAGLPVLPARQTCDADIAEVQANMVPIREFVDELKHDGTVPVATIDEQICRSGRCRASEGSVLLYADESHLTAEGSELLGRRMRWGEWPATMGR